jgi:hypothetical protein
MTAEQKRSMQQQALLAFHHDLPQLWSERPGQWVAYRGNQRLDFAAEKHLMYQNCLQLGLERDEFVVFCIEPQETEIVIGPVILD